MRFLLWTLLGAVLFALGATLSAAAGTDYVKKGSNQLGPAIMGLTLLWYPFVLYSCLGALSRLKKARRVLEGFPWLELPTLRKSGRESTGIAVQLPLPGSAQKAFGDGSAGAADDGAQWSPTMCARDPRRYNRWDAQLERGAWFAGDPVRWGVLALPGGAGLMTIHASMANLSADRTSAGKELEGVLASAPSRS
ncbi:hypothetical protein N566_26035 [Streptomycetaceae bacterium MP113-05]|nr:hypothetical protein N566_26035 [Streptomycetaceae bacterium MP113-05]